MRAREWGVWRGTTELILKGPLIECFGQTKKIGTTVLRQSWTSFSLVVEALIDFHVPLGGCVLVWRSKRMRVTNL